MVPTRFEQEAHALHGALERCQDERSGAILRGRKEIIELLGLECLSDHGKTTDILCASGHHVTVVLPRQVRP